VRRSQAVSLWCAEPVLIFDSLDLGDGDLGEAPFAAVEQQSMLGLPGVDGDHLGRPCVRSSGEIAAFAQRPATSSTVSRRMQRQKDNVFLSFHLLAIK
jgi:hypothetical protein